MFIKLNRDENIKRRTVAAGNRQKDLTAKEDVILTTVSTEEVILNCVIDVQEGRYVAVIDTPKAFIQIKLEKEEYMVTIIVRGDLVYVLSEIAPELYNPYTRNDKKGKNILII